jgi:hypothetical protein
MKFLFGLVIVGALVAGIYYGRRYLKARSAGKGPGGKAGTGSATKSS